MPSSVSRTGSPSAGMVTATLPGCSETTSCSTILTPIFSSAVSALLGSEPTVPSGTPGPIDSMTVTVVPLGRRSPALTPTRPRHLPLPRALNICFFLTRKPLASSSRDTSAAVRYRTVGTVRGPIHSSFLAARPNPVPARTTSTAMIAAMSFMRGRLADGCAAADPVGLAGGVAEFPAGTVGGVPASPAFAANAAKPSSDVVSDALGGNGPVAAPPCCHSPTRVSERSVSQEHPALQRRIAAERRTGSRTDCPRHMGHRNADNIP